MLEVRLVQPDFVMEVAIDIARDSAGRWRHPARPGPTASARRST
ncbi:hypothetical protein [Streptomyces sp. NPDC020298]